MKIIETDHHVVKFETKQDYKVMIKECEKLGVNLDYYFFEFDCNEEIEEWVDRTIMVPFVDISLPVLVKKIESKKELRVL